MKKRNMNYVIGFVFSLLFFAGVCNPITLLAEVTAVPVIPISSMDELQQHINKDGAYSSQDVLALSESAVHKITVEKSGYLVIKAYCSQGSVSSITLYSNASLISKITDLTYIGQTGNTLVYYLEKGDYYYKVQSAANDNTATVYIGTAPTPEEIKEVTLSLSNMTTLDDLQDYINQGGAYSSYDLLGKDNLAPDTISHKITVPEDGFLVLRPSFSAGTSNSMYLYNDVGLTSIISATTIGGNCIYQLNRGEYYYKLQSLYITKNTATVYTGFAPLKKVATSIINLTNMSSVNDLQAYIDQEGAYSNHDLLGRDNLALDSMVYKITVKQSGFLVLHPSFTGDTLHRITLYRDAELKSVLNATRVDSNTICYLDKGNYYYKLQSLYTTNNTATMYTGFIPTAPKIKVKSTKLHNDKASANVLFQTGCNYQEIAIVKGSVSYSDLNNDTIWSKKNVVANSKYTITANGTYTAKITEANTNLSYMVSFQVSGIKSTKPSTPKVTTYKRNTKVIKGTGTAYTTAYAVINKKVYKATVDKNGNFSIKTTQLKKQTKVAVYLKNSSGKTSTTKTVTVK